MRKQITVRFKFFWPGWSLDRFKKNFPFLEEKYDIVEITDYDIEADVAFIGGFHPEYGHKHLLSHDLGIFYGAHTINCGYYVENKPWNTDIFNYSISARRDYDSNPNHLWVSPGLLQLNYMGIPLSALQSKMVEPKEKFCNFIYSNPVPFRESFCKKLSEYKRVDCPGSSCNNMDRLPPGIEAKKQFQQQYKFTIAFENSISNGYICEKLVDPMLLGSIPIYYGAPDVYTIFNTKAFIWNGDYDNYQEMIEAVKRVDRDDGLYKAMLEEPWFKDNKIPWEVSPERQMEFFDKMFGEV